LVRTIQYIIDLLDHIFPLNEMMRSWKCFPRVSKMSTHHTCVYKPTKVSNLIRNFADQFENHDQTTHISTKRIVVTHNKIIGYPFV
jgi:hypothetical protein